MEAAATDTSFEPNPWVTGVSIEDDAGVIHEIELPAGVCREQEFIDRFLARVRPPLVRVPPPADTAADLAVMFVLGFWTFIFGNLLFTVLLGTGAPRDWMPVEGCVIKGATGKCVADLA